MSKKEVRVVGGMSKWSGVLKDMFRQIDDGSLAIEHFQAFLEHKNPFAVQAAQAAMEVIIEEWRKLYFTLGIFCNLSEVVIPDDPGGFNRVIIMAKGVKPQWAYDKCSGLFRCCEWTDENLDEMVTSDRNAKNGPYAVRVRDRVEADRELKNMSANDLKRQNIASITLEERLVYELKYFRETGGYLDIQNVTLCSGSRCSDGDVPDVSWGGGELDVSWGGPDVASGHLRSRQVVF